ncbi:hypothetical protein EW145_g6359 [Phellinidium pouzarii]|uniref:Peroxisome membrane anchor protein Pex14p N-terminal domain-containing protein n=1 Tax=Phellinidium pouzarii TaxID=167371 RepID=A0A4S4KWW3_9AGAM|nr:hypothetical protein EW145_g6359 [Phellinidium pouzarii]
MADDDNSSSEQPALSKMPSNLEQPREEVSAPLSVPAATPSLSDGLLDRARVFLTSPHIVHEPPESKRRFLAEKGLNNEEIESLMRELPPHVPPRTYPQSPPSNLPYLLMGLTKIMTWLTGGSAVLILIYYRFLLPRLTRSALARRSLKQHQTSLLTRLNESLASLKSSQAEAFAVLPSPSPSPESSDLAQKHSLKDLRLEQDAAIEIPEHTFLRCAIEDLSAEGKKATKEELFSLLQVRFTWLKSEKGAEYEKSLWQTLTNDPHFSEVKEKGRLVWTYKPVSPDSPPTPFMESIASLKLSLSPRPQSNPYQRTFEALSDFTGYITTQTYQLASSTMRMPSLGLGMSTPLAPQQEEIRKEIRALKGLVLNRCGAFT